MHTFTFRKFQQGDKVSYIGRKYAQDLSGSLGIVEATVGNDDSGLVVSFGGDSYIMRERNLARFQGKVKDPSEDASAPKDVEITRRKGKSKRSEEDSE